MRFLLPRTIARLDGELRVFAHAFEHAHESLHADQRAIAHAALDRVPRSTADAVTAGHGRRARRLLVRAAAAGGPWDAAGVPWLDVLTAAIAETE